LELEAERGQTCRLTAATRGPHRRLSDLHPTAKPIALVADAILDCTQRDDIVLDAFVGSGTTISGAAVGVAPPHPISRKRVFLSD
jgi:DNA methylase